jgi:hypothetical protein
MNALTGSVLTGFPITFSPATSDTAFISLPGIADLNGDSFPDIYFLGLKANRTGQINSYQEALYAYDRNGNALPQFNPLPLFNYQNIPQPSYSLSELGMPVVTDFTDDGSYEIVTTVGWGSLQAISNPGFAKNPRASCLPEYGGNEKNTKIINRCSDIKYTPAPPAPIGP